MERDRSYAAMHRDIQVHAQQAINDADFMKAVRSIRERKERERAAALAAASRAARRRPPGRFNVVALMGKFSVVFRFSPN